MVKWTIEGGKSLSCRLPLSAVAGQSLRLVYQDPSTPLPSPYSAPQQGSHSLSEYARGWAMTGGNICGKGKEREEREHKEIQERREREEREERRLMEDVRVAALRQQHIERLSGALRAGPQKELVGFSPHRGGRVWPVPQGKLMLSRSTCHLASQVMGAWSLAMTFCSELQLTHFWPNTLCAALQRDGESVLLAELHMRLLTALLHPAHTPRLTQFQPPAEPSQLLQQLPSADCVTPSSWPEVVRCVCGLLPSIHTEPPVLSALEEWRVRGEYVLLRAEAKLSLLQALCDAWLESGGGHSTLRGREGKQLELMREHERRVREVDAFGRSTNLPPRRLTLVRNPHHLLPMESIKEASKEGEKAAGSTGAESNSTAAPIPNLTSTLNPSCTPYPTPPSTLNPTPALIPPPSILNTTHTLNHTPPLTSTLIPTHTRNHTPSASALNPTSTRNPTPPTSNLNHTPTLNPTPPTSTLNPTPSSPMPSVAATHALLAAIRLREVGALETAIREAEEGGHCGGGVEGAWRTSELCCAHELLDQLQANAGREIRRRELREEDRRHFAAMAECGVRETSLGSDREGRRYWLFAHDPSLLWVEVGGEWSFYWDKQQIRRLDDCLDGSLRTEAALKVELRRRCPAMADVDRVGGGGGGAGGEGGGSDKEEEEWSDGHPFVGRMAVRVFNGHSVLGRLTGYLPPDERTGDPALFHMLHEDGDEEDLEEAEAVEAVRAAAALCGESEDEGVSCLDGREVKEREEESGRQGGGMAEREGMGAGDAVCFERHVMGTGRGSSNAACDGCSLGTAKSDVSFCCDGNPTLCAEANPNPNHGADPDHCHDPNQNHNADPYPKPSASALRRGSRRRDGWEKQKKPLKPPQPPPLLQPAYLNCAAPAEVRASADNLGLPGAHASVLALEKELLPLLQPAEGVQRAAGGKRGKAKGERNSRAIKGGREGGRRSDSRGPPSVGQLAARLLGLEGEVYGLQTAEDAVEGRPWRSDHHFVGQSARRFFPHLGVGGLASFDGKIDGWLPPEDGDPPLWHMIMEDGDDEELEEGEAWEAIQSFLEARQPPAQPVESATKQAEMSAAPEPVALSATKSEKSEKSEGGASTARLWATAECRERWRNALLLSPSCATVALCAYSLRLHTSAFASPDKRRNPSFQYELDSWYHANAFILKEDTWSRQKKRKLKM
ncbi:MAG: hypothetical protein SGPRY_008391 [Prymnesium sp.]